MHICNLSSHTFLPGLGAPRPPGAGVAGPVSTGGWARHQALETAPFKLGLLLPGRRDSPLSSMAGDPSGVTIVLRALLDRTSLATPKGGEAF